MTWCGEVRPANMEASYGMPLVRRPGAIRFFGLINVEEAARRHGAFGNAVPVAVVVHFANGNHAARHALNVSNVAVVARAGPGDGSGNWLGADREAGGLGVV